MMKKTTWTMIGLSAVIMLGSISGCSNKVTASADELIANVIESEHTPDSYSADLEMKVFEGDKLIEHAIVKEFSNKDGQKKIITENAMTKEKSIALNDGKQVLMYDEATGKALSMDMTEAADNMSPKDQVIAMLDAMKETHDKKVVGEEKINGINTQHLKLQPKSKNTLMGETDLWIDQKTWFVLKSTMVTEDMRTETTYKNVDFSPSFKKDTFTLDIPKDVKIDSIEDMQTEKPVKMEEAEQALGQPFLIFPEEFAQSTTITADELKGEINRTEVNIEYKKDQEPYVSLSVFPTPEGKDVELSTEDGTTVRGQKAEITAEINAVSWDEDGLRYVLMPLNPDLSVEDFIPQVENMQLSN
ncbi:LolA family protein [Bacillus sp. Hm123]|uniref:LolA family protein n=1 Tax=Bacillus sp. Hm123 TaxID=3450745 RepID=UPI003F426674